MILSPVTIQYLSHNDIERLLFSLSADKEAVKLTLKLNRLKRWPAAFWYY